MPSSTSILHFFLKIFLLDFALFIEDFGNNAYNYQLHNVGPAHGQSHVPRHQEPGNLHWCGIINSRDMAVEDGGMWDVVGGYAAICSD